MDISQIITKRNQYGYSFYDIVYEWEDEIAKSLNLIIINDNISRRNNLFLFHTGLSRFVTTNRNSIVFNMLPSNYAGLNKRNIVPIIIDFYLKENELKDFSRNYKDNPAVLVTSLEVYDYLKRRNLPINLFHWPLSIPDKYKCSQSNLMYKKYDLVMLGRQNSVLTSFVKEYKRRHADFIYVERILRGNDFIYITSEGDNVGQAKSRSDYFNLMKKGRVALYATAGMDDNKDSTHGYHQVTPRFLEYISCGCHVLCRYMRNADTDFYEFNKYWPSIDTYEQFEFEMDKLRSTTPKLDFISDYLAKHYTSVRVKQLQDILGKI